MGEEIFDSAGKLGGGEVCESEPRGEDGVRMKGLLFEKALPVLDFGDWQVRLIGEGFDLVFGQILGGMGGEEACLDSLWGAEFGGGFALFGGEELRDLGLSALQVLLEALLGGAGVG